MPASRLNRNNADQANRIPSDRALEGGFTLVEVMVVTVVFIMLMISAFGTLYVDDKGSRHQAENSTALEIVQGRLEWFRGLPYDYPSATFSNASYSITTNMTITLDNSGSTNLLQALVSTTVAPFQVGTNVVGHLITSSITLNTSKSPRTIQLQSFVNPFSSIQ
jgi:type II secretory pathway pseudopilin PulG